MNFFEFAIARTYSQLLATSEQRVLSAKETRLLQNLEAIVIVYQARELATARRKEGPS